MGSNSYENEKAFLLNKFERELRKLCRKHSVETSSARDDIYSEIAVSLQHREKRRVIAAKRSAMRADEKFVKKQKSELSVKEKSVEKIVPSVLEGNKFADLSTDDEETDMELTVDVDSHMKVSNYPKKITSMRKINADNSEKATMKNVAINEKGSEARKEEEAIEGRGNTRSPPIICFDLNVRELRRELNAQETPPQYLMKNINKTKTVIKPTTIGDQKAIMQVLKKYNIRAHTFTPKGEKNQVLMLRGPHFTCDASELMAELKEKAPAANILKIENFKTRYSSKVGISYNLFVVVVDAATNVKDLTSIRAVDGQAVVWERKRNQEDVQCHNCQLYGHVAVNCTAKYRCMKCKGGHVPGSCPNNKKDDGEETIAQKPYCVLCGTEGHVASYKGCQAYQKLKKARKQRVVEATEKRQEARAVLFERIKPGKTFSDLFKTKPLNKNVIDNKNKATKNGEVDHFMTNECQNLFGMDLFTLVGRVNDFLPTYKAAKTTQERQMAYINFAFNLCG